MAGVPYFSNLRAERDRADRSAGRIRRDPPKRAGFSLCLPIFSGAGRSGKRDPQSKTISEDLFPSSEPKAGLLHEAVTTRVIEKAFEEANKSKFIDFASNEAAQSLAKLAQSKAGRLNPLPVTGPPPLKKRRKDIFD